MYIYRTEKIVNYKKPELVISKVKEIAIDYVYSESRPKTNFSDFVKEKTGYNYTYLGNIFSKVEKEPILSFLIKTKIDRAKFLLVEGKLTLTEISELMFYSSVCHLSNQFKQVTGVSPTEFKLSKKLNEA